jgi:predicted nucleotidyltransferase
VTGGFAFDSVWERRVETTLGGSSLYMVGLDDLIALKQAAGRPRDLLAVEDLKKRKQQLANKPEGA